VARPGASVRAAAGGADFRIEAQDFSRVLIDAKAFEPALAKSIRKNIREAARPAVADVRRTVLETPTKGTRTFGVRRAIAQGVGVRISAARGGGGVNVAASGRRLPANRKPMVKLLNRERWRHPVFGDRDTWAQQSGRPYFGSVLWRYRDDIRDAVQRALDEAASNIR
jgi:hypothetical protein